MRFWLTRRTSGLLVAGVLAATVGLVGCTRPATGQQAAARQPAAAGSTGVAPPARDFDPAHPAVEPTSAEIGRRYPFDLLVHCTGEYTRFAGSLWRTDTPPGDVPPSPDAAGVARYTGYLPGWMTRTGPDTAVFESPGRRVEYRRVDDAPLCA